MAAFTLMPGIAVPAAGAHVRCFLSRQKGGACQEEKQGQDKE